jgi:hypothetical protein
MSTSMRFIEKIWLIYFMVMIPISSLVDLQTFWPIEVPAVLQGVKQDWIVQSNDFLFEGKWAGKVEMAW